MQRIQHCQTANAQKNTQNTSIYLAVAEII